MVLLDTAFVVTEIVMDQKIKNYETYCHGSQSSGCQQGEHDAHHWEHVAHAIHICSIIVLSIFMVEVRDHFADTIIFEKSAVKIKSCIPGKSLLQNIFYMGSFYQTQD